MRDLLGDATSPGNALPGEEEGNGFGNDADRQSVASLLAEQYGIIAESIAVRATAPMKLQALVPCAAKLGGAASTAAETVCVEDFVKTFATRGYRRPLAPGEAAQLVALFTTVRKSGIDFPGSIATVVEAVLLSPDFLYRPEFGVAVSGQQGLKRPTGYEMATRLSYLLWGTLPDSGLTEAAAAGDLDTPQGVRAAATRMLDDVRSQVTGAFFFDNWLPIARLSALARDPELYPTFSPKVGALLRQETQTFVKHVVFDTSGSLDEIFTAPYTFANADLAKFYGFSGVSGDDFRKVPLDTNQRLGILTQAGVLAGSVKSNHTNPVTRSVFVLRKILCQDLPLPNASLAAFIKPPDPYEGATTRERFAAHSKNAVCAGCHVAMDPIGLAQENFDAVGLWRDKENDVVIDAKGELQLLGAPYNGPVELAKRVAATAEVKTCFAQQWMTFAYGRTLADADKCTVDAVQGAFAKAGHNVKALLLALTQSDAFLYLSDEKE